jgi:hypothetical protein
MNNYLGMRDPKGNAVVKMNGVSFDPARSQQLRNHSPDGFEWGYGGSGPSQLALALLLEELDEESALSLYQDFKWVVIAQLASEWMMDSNSIRSMVSALPR